MLDIVARMVVTAEPELSQKSDRGIVSKVAKLLSLEAKVQLVLSYLTLM